LAIVSCPGCSQKLRLPDSKRGTVTCPQCGAEWFHPETVELSDVEFRCSASGARFNVISSRRSPLHKFVIQATRKAAPRTAHSPEPESRSSSQQLAFKASTALPGARSKIGGWLVRIVEGKAPGVPAPRASAIAGKADSLDAKAAAATHDAEEYNWSGFVCPYCNASSFVSCVGGHLACDGTIQVRKGGRFHQCFCGQAGFIVGTIKTLEGKRLSVDAQAASPNESAAKRTEQNSKPAGVVLPTQRNGLPTKR
jgi:hypothetical protein